MLDQANRTFICSVVFIDLVGYSKKPVTEQIRLKTSLTNNLSEAIKDIPVSDRIILDTGDGAAISFLGDPEDALFVTLSLREKMVAENATATMVEATGEDAVRMGINLGPVKLVKDINGHPNIIGDGINVAQRIMSFARPGQIVVSRSYYDVVSNLASEYAKLFHYEGSRTDKHVREHEIYVVGHHEGALQKAKDGMKDRASSTSPNARKAGTPTGVSTVTLTMREKEADPRVPVSDVRTQAADIDQTINQEITFAELCSGFAILALVIACVGLYGTVSYNVARRTGEIGIRMALGAQRASVVRMVLREVLVLSAVGLAIGMATALVTSKFVASFLYGMKPNDPLALTLSVITLLGAALLAGYVPARKASRIDPMAALRHE